MADIVKNPAANRSHGVLRVGFHIDRGVAVLMLVPTVAAIVLLVLGYQLLPGLLLVAGVMVTVVSWYRRRPKDRPMYVPPVRGQAQPRPVTPAGLAVAQSGAFAALFQRTDGRLNLANRADLARERQRSIIRIPLQEPLTILFAGAKGGVGKTCTAAETANAFNDTLGCGVLYLDVNRKGNIYMRLGLASNGGLTVADLYAAIQSKQVNSRHDFLRFTQRTDAGVYVLGRAHKGQTPLTPEALETIHKIARLFFDFIVLDGGNETESALMRMAAELADISVEVVTPQGDSLQLALEDVEYLRTQNEDGHILVVLNEQSPANPQQVGATFRAFTSLELPCRQVRHIGTLQSRRTLMWRNMPPAAQDDYREIAATLVAIAAGLPVPMLPEGVLFSGKSATSAAAPAVSESNQEEELAAVPATSGNAPAPLLISDPGFGMPDLPAAEHPGNGHVPPAPTQSRVGALASRLLSRQPVAPAPSRAEAGPVPTANFEEESSGAASAEAPPAPDAPQAPEAPEHPDHDREAPETRFSYEVDDLADLSEQH